MILRKPYAFFIKQFKIIHIILTLMIAYLIYQTGLSLAFFNEYISTNQSVIDQDLTGNLFNIYMFIIPFLIIIASITILSVMYVKKKPYLFYIIIILIYLSMIFIYNYTYSTLGLMEAKLLDIRTVRMNRDILMMAFAAQTLSVIITFVRATGFDIRKFNFGQDLQELEISEADREEFEVDVAVDTDKVQRRIRRNFRYARYVYVENKFLIHMFSLIIFATICFVVYLNLNVYNKVYNEKEAFLATNFSMFINESYLTKKDYAGNNITDENTSLVVLELEVKNNYTKNKKLDIARTELIVGDQKFFHNYTYREKLFDLGKVYEDALLPNNFTKHLLVYEVPTDLLKANEIKFVYVDKVDYIGGKLNPKNITVNINPKKLDEVNKTNKYVLGDTIDFSESVLDNVKLMINKYEVANQFKLDYQFCVEKDECYDSYEYIKPDVINQYRKTLLYLNGQITWDEELAVDPVTSLYKFINLFGKVVYELDEETKEQIIPVKEVNPTKIKRKNDYYIELLSEINKADKLAIIFNIRDIKYEYIIK